MKSCRIITNWFLVFLFTCTICGLSVWWLTYEQAVIMNSAILVYALYIRMVRL